ncbi:MAG: UvrD-helicase domain-containing protein [Candidatus Solibacter usitatus]|nr:UvrD-helicase domain-containing protein [Candidatus Solibacter usitatus]
MTPAIQIDDARARQIIREALDESLVVEAAAGTGKTSELVRRIVAVLQQGRATIDQIVAVTFTRKAAGELKLRLRQELDRARAATADPIETRRLEEAVARLEEAHAGTIHSFCAEILRERPVEAVVDPAFGDMNELEAPRLFEQVFRRWMQEKLDQESPGLRRALSRIASREGNDWSPLEQLQEAGHKLVEWRDFTGAWRRDPLDIEEEIDALVRDVQLLDGMVALCRRTNDNLVRALQPLVNLCTWISRAEEVRSRDYFALEGLLIKLEKDLKADRRKGSGVFAERVSREEAATARDRLLQALAGFKERADADLAALLWSELRYLIPRYNERKRREGKLDFLDLLICARNLVRDNPEVRAYLQGRFTHIFVDEFQDTDPLQAEILLLLASADPAQADWRKVTPAPGKLFLVGDPKQSIYRFRRADVLLYQSVVEGLTARGARLVRLAKSFRAVRPLQQAINAAFAPEMTGDPETGQPSYVPLQEHALSGAPQPALVALPVPSPYGKQRIARSSVDACLPDAVAAYVEWLLGSSGWTVRDPENPEGRVPISSRHICILFRRFVNWGQDVTRHYTRSLEARGVPHLLVGARSFHRREEVETLRAALTAIEWPDDELSVFAALKGSLFAIPDSLLLRFRMDVGPLNPFRKPPEDLAGDFRPLAEALELLAGLHRRRNRRPIVGTVNALLEATRAHAGFALRPGGNQVLANVYRVCDLARAFELSGGISFRGFVEELSAQAERQESVEAPVLEEGAEGVRIMTVHTAKGLEFPVVILADITANLASYQPDRYVEGDVCAMRLLGCTPRELLEHQDREGARDAAEGVRVAYVAATRARDLLVVPAVGDEQLDGWLAPLHKAIYPDKNQARKSAAAPACPRFGEDSAIERPSEIGRPPAGSVRPGLHRIGEHEVVWWDPHQLRLNEAGKFGLRQEEILAEDSVGEAGQSILRYQQWRERRAKIVEQGSRPRFQPFRASEAAGLPPGWTPKTQVAEAARPIKRPSGRRFGTLVHAVLRDIALDPADREACLALVRIQGRVLGSSEEEIAAAAEAVQAALGHPLLRRAAAAGRCDRELPVLLKLDEQRVFEGVIDLAFLENGVWTVLDFKTDALLSVEKYQLQLEWYVFALERITGQPASGWLVPV